MISRLLLPSFLRLADIGKRWLVVAHPNNRNAIQGGIGLTAAAAIEPEAVGLSA
jgi:hypothetical protein